MSPIHADPYINFQGKCREAMTVYHDALGGTLEMHAAGKPGEPTHPAAPDESIMHAQLEGDGFRIMGTDGMPTYPPAVGDHMAVALSGSDHALLTAAFAKLGDGGKVKQPLQKADWGDEFGWLEDKFGINWMINISPEKE